MSLNDFVRQVGNFAALTDNEQVKHFAWYLHRHQGQETFDTAAIRRCYSELGMREPNVSEVLSRLFDRRHVVKFGGKYRLEKSARDVLDEKHGDAPTTVAISQLLRSLPGRISDENERTFLAEVLRCYGAQAFRAATVMVWNLAYDHLLTWLVADSKRLADFNAGIPVQAGGRRPTIVITRRDDFEDLRERQVLDIASKANVISDGVKKILVMGLDRRNLAAHPSGVEIGQPTADDMIHSLVTNVVLKLSRDV